MSKTNFKEKFLENTLKQVILLLGAVIVWFVSEMFDIDLFYLLKSFPIEYSVIIVLLLLLSSAGILIYYSRIKNRTDDAVCNIVKSERTSKRKTLKYSMLIMICISLLISLGHILPTVNLSGKIEQIDPEDEFITEVCMRKFDMATEKYRLRLITADEYRNEIKRIKKTQDLAKTSLKDGTEKE